MAKSKNKKRQKSSIQRVNDLLSLTVVALAFYILAFPLFPKVSFYIDRSIDDTEGYVYMSNLAAEAFGNQNMDVELDESTSEPDLDLSNVQKALGRGDVDKEQLVERLVEVIEDNPGTVEDYSLNEYIGELMDYAITTVVFDENDEEKDFQIEIESNLKDFKAMPEVNTLVIPKIGVDGEIFEGENASTLDKGIWRRPNSSTPSEGGNTVVVAHRFMYESGPNTFYHLDKMEVGDKFLIFWDGEEFDYEVFDVSVVSPESIEIEEDTEEEIITLYTCTPLWTSQNRLVVKAKKIG